jgi:hypothetical protein
MLLLTTFVTFISPFVVPWGVALSGILLGEPTVPGPIGPLYFESFALWWTALSWPFVFVFLHLSLYKPFGLPLIVLTYFYLFSCLIFVTFFAVRPPICYKMKF